MRSRKASNNVTTQALSMDFDVWYGVFTDREWALIAWLVIGLTWIFTSTSLRPSFVRVLGCLLRPIFVACFGVAGAYIGLCVWAMHQYGLWKADNIKTTIVWTLTVAFVAMFRTKQLGNRDFYRKIIGEALSLTALLIFVTELYTFPFIVEFILFPVLLFFSLILESSKRDPKHKFVGSFSGCVLGLIVASYVLYSVYRSFTDPATLFTLGNGRDLIVPAILTILFLPFLYAFGIWARYNDTFAILPIWLPDGRLRRYAKRQAFLRFGADVKALDRWRHIVVSSKPSTQKGVMQSIVEAWSMGIRDRHPLPVPKGDGWEPISAGQMLGDYSLGTTDYKPIGGGEWHGSSPFFQVGPSDGAWHNHLAFYVCGSQFAATELTLSLDVNLPLVALAAHDQFIVVSMALVETAVGADGLEEVKVRLAELLEFTETLDGTQVSLIREDWSGGAIKGGYEWVLKLRRGQ
jgi:hypothetical protein